MNKLIIGLLVIAAGTGAFFLLRQKKETTSSSLKTKWIIGQWETDSFSKTDSVPGKHQFDFQKNGMVIRSLNDSAKADTTHFEWNKTNELVWKEKATDSTGKIYVVTKLTPDSLQVQCADCSTVLFTKLK